MPNTLSSTHPPPPLSIAQMDSHFYESPEDDNNGCLFCSSSWFRVKNNLLEPLALTNRIHLTAGILVIENSQVRIIPTFNMGLSLPLFVYLRPFDITIEIEKHRCRLEFKPKASGWWAQTDPMSYDGTFCSTISLK